MPLHRSVLAIAAVLLLGACTHRAPGETPAPARPVTTLVVQNTRAEPFDMYVSDGTRRLYMGQARPLRSTSLRIPSTMVFPATTLQFIAVPLSGVGGAISERLAVSPGETVHLMLAR